MCMHNRWADRPQATNKCEKWAFSHLTAMESSLTTALSLPPFLGMAVTCALPHKILTSQQNPKLGSRTQPDPGAQILYLELSPSAVLPFYFSIPPWFGFPFLIGIIVSCIRQALLFVSRDLHEQGHGSSQLRMQATIQPMKGRFVFIITRHGQCKTTSAAKYSSLKNFSIIQPVNKCQGYCWLLIIHM